MVIAILGLAELAARKGWVSNLILPAPTDVWSTLRLGFEQGAYWEHIEATVIGTLGGFFIAAVSAVLLAGIMVSVPRLERVFMPIVAAFQTLPKIAIAPLIILWLGFGETGKIVTAALGCFFPILVNALQGFRVRDVEQVELFASLGASRYQMFRFVRFPNAIPFIMAGFHIGILFALVGAIVADFVGSQPGLGYRLLIDKETFNVPGVYAVLVILMVFGIILHVVLRLIERRVAFWAEDMSHGKI